jgi:hypothetical protein
MCCAALMPLSALRQRYAGNWWAHLRFWSGRSFPGAAHTEIQREGLEGAAQRPHDAARAEVLQRP